MPPSRNVGRSSYRFVNEHDSTTLWVLSIVSLLCGVWLAAASILGFGVGDTWIIYPPNVAVLLLALLMIGLPLWWFGRFVTKQKKITLLQIIVAFVLLGITLGILE